MRQKRLRGRKKSELPEAPELARKMINLTGVPLKRIPFCECGCSTLMHNGARSDGSCLLHPDCKKYKER